MVQKANQNIFYQRIRIILYDFFIDKTTRYGRNFILMLKTCSPGKIRIRDCSCSHVNSHRC